MPLYRRVFDRACRSILYGSLTVDYWDGTTATYGSGEPHGHLKILKPSVLPGLIFNPELAFGEAYTRGDLEIVGEIDKVVAVFAAEESLHPLFEKLMNAAGAIMRFRPLSMRRHRNDIRRHYDLGNEFYRLWLDPTMTYSCAYFASPDEDLETAQRRKIRHTLDKLHLQPGESLLDVGCGWGGLIREAAERDGVDALGITLSEEQVAWFRSSKSADSTKGTAQSELLHYHALAASGRQFDKIVSVGMAEHVGQRQLPGYFADLRRLLRPGGLGLVHCITYPEKAPTSPWILKYIFPGGYIPSVGEVVDGLARQGFILWDMENIGPHYALTLDRWAEAFERNAAWVEERYGTEFVRMWRLYLRYCAASFRHEDVYVHQMLFSNGKPNSLPLTRIAQNGITTEEQIGIPERPNDAAASADG